MKYTREQRMCIAKRVYDGAMTVEEAAVKYELNPSTVKGYLRLYRIKTGLLSKTGARKTGKVTPAIKPLKDSSLNEYESMSKEELIDALVMARINEARLKKGYLVKGSGAKKEYLPIDSENTK